MLYARTNAEAHLYMDLHPCACGSSDFERDSTLVEQGDDLVSVYEGPCRACGKTRRFEFLLPESLPPAGVVFGGDEPSQIICPGEFLIVSDEHARRVPASAAGLSPEARERARRDLRFATAAIEEVVKLIPADADRLPPGAFKSTAGKELYLRDPGRCSRLRLGAVIEAYREIAAQLVH